MPKTKQAAPNFEKLGEFYLGKIINPATRKTTDEPVFYESKDLTTHAACIGMTGSGKTGLGITILEEAALDKIPAIIIDPKGDLGNLLLTFPNLSPEDFLPWIDKAEAERKGMSPEEYATTAAKTWKEGLEKWGEDGERIKKLRDSIDMEIYTPASKAGIPLSILSSFAAPSKELMQDPGALRDRVLSITSSVLGLLGIDADPIKSREHILISTILEQAWIKGKDLDIASLIRQVQKPPFDKIGVLDLDTFFPAKDRMALSISLNNLLASPGFQAWMEGRPLNIKDLLYTKEGKPKLSILSIAHLSDPERMFFVTLLLNEFISWMRQQSGTTSLRTILYMDEIFGYFPPTAMPPSKKPMLTLLKQARAYGIGIILCTQNPVDLDYKGLSNCGTWFIGKLQTERDKSRVIEGLRLASNGEIEANSLDKMIALTGNRIFIMRSIHQKDPIIFETRWAMSYLRGPLTLAQISELEKNDSEAIEEAHLEKPEIKATKLESKPMVPTGIQEFFLKRQNTPLKTYYRPLIAGMAKLHFVDKPNKIDTWQNICLLAPVSDDGKTVLWDEAQTPQEMQGQLTNDPKSDSTFEELPAGLMQEKNYAAFEKSFAAALYQNQTFEIFHVRSLNLISKEGESEGDFKTRVDLAIREKRDESIKKIKEQYTKKEMALEDKVRQIEEKITQLKQKASWGIAETLISFLSTIIGALFGRGVTKGTITQTGTSMRRAGRITKENQNVNKASEDSKFYQAQLDELRDQKEKEIAQVNENGNYPIETITIRPRKTDIAVEQIALVWST
jgi:hypothetical protein